MGLRFMNSKKQSALAALAGGVAVLLGVQAAPAFAEETDALKFSVSQTLSRDNNLYRLSDDEPDTGGKMRGKRSDSISVTRAGANFDKEYGRQGIHAGLSASRTLYRRHSDLNNTSPDARLRWDWGIGDHWSGALGYSYSESFVGFEEAGGDERVMRRLGRATGSANYWFHPNWALGVGVGSVRSTYRDDQRPTDEYDARETSLNLTYRPATGNRIVFSLRNENGQFSERDKQEGSLRDWQQRDARFSGEWQLTGVTRVNGYIGYSQREYEYASSRDFRGMTGSLGLHWVPTPKAIVDLSWRREIGADQDAASNFAVVHSWILQPTWVVTDKVRLGATLKTSKRDYRGTSPDASWTGAARYDRTQSYGLNLQYAPASFFDLTLGIQREKRDSKWDDRRDYDAQTTWLSGNFTF
ncbi:MAG: outer membrane beta-barrel protein [Azoarcus sp.]|jgi:exopolysaccharide biosynthesis operon protein EpsL|nr:outer membrane beta-barrel protein [Azoarcus sp.]